MMSNEGALATLDDNMVFERLASGELTKTIAAEYGVRKESLRERLIKRNPDRYKAVIKEQAESIVEAATQECMECPADMPIIARARLKLEAAHKWAAARYPEVWGRQNGVSLTINQVALDSTAIAGISDLLTRASNSALTIEHKD